LKSISIAAVCAWGSFIIEDRQMSLFDTTRDLLHRLPRSASLDEDLEDNICKSFEKKNEKPPGE
jgi:hypothetical protein